MEKSLNLLELTVCFDSNFDSTVQRKLAKYNEPWEQAKQNGYSTILLPIQMGSRGVPHYQSFATTHWYVQRGSGESIGSNCPGISWTC